MCGTQSTIIIDGHFSRFTELLKAPLKFKSKIQICINHTFGCVGGHRIYRFSAVYRNLWKSQTVRCISVWIVWTTTKHLYQSSYMKCKIILKYCTLVDIVSCMEGSSCLYATNNNDRINQNLSAAASPVESRQLSICITVDMEVWRYKLLYGLSLWQSGKLLLCISNE